MEMVLHGASRDEQDPNDVTRLWIDRHTIV